jgi:hypothetical protein
MVWGAGQQRLSLVLARGQASLVLGAVAAARNNAEGPSGVIGTQGVACVIDRDGLPATRLSACEGWRVHHTPVPTPHLDV